MKTHRQALIEKLDNEFGKTVNATQAMIGHLLLLCDMLDERADQFRGVTEKIETPAEHAETVRLLEREFRDDKSWELERHAFPDELAERLAVAILGAYPGGWEHAPEHDRVCARKDARTALSALASMPCEWPTMPNFEEVQSTYHHVKPYGLEAVMDLYWQRTAPVFAAKDARIAKLDSEVQHAETDAEGLGHELNDAKKRIAELEKRLAEVETRRIEYLGKNHQQPGDLRMALDRMFALEKRIAELTAPMVVDGKTPGQVLINSQWGSESIQVSREMLESAEIDARAVLRAFGNGAEVLRQVRKTIRESLPAARDAGSVWKIDEERVYAIIDAEIAKLA